MTTTFFLITFVFLMACVVVHACDISFKSKTSLGMVFYYGFLPIRLSSRIVRFLLIAMRFTATAILVILACALFAVRVLIGALIALFLLAFDWIVPLCFGCTFLISHNNLYLVLGGFSWVACLLKRDERGPLFKSGLWRFVSRGEL
jgi:hypothetical protein